MYTARKSRARPSTSFGLSGSLRMTAALGGGGSAGGGGIAWSALGAPRTLIGRSSGAIQYTSKAAPAKTAAMIQPIGASERERKGPGAVEGLGLRPRPAGAAMMASVEFGGSGAPVQYRDCHASRRRTARR